MKITYRNHPILESLKDGELNVSDIEDVDMPGFLSILGTVEAHFKENVNAFNSEINIIRQPFAEATSNAEQRLFDMLTGQMEIDKAKLDVKGTFVVADMVYFINTETTDSGIDLCHQFYAFSRYGYPIAIHIIDFKTKEEIRWATQLEGFSNENEIMSYIVGHTFSTIALSMFKKYAKVETKLLKPNRKVKEIGCKYFNDTNIDFTILDSAWFTNLVRSEGFKVNGHFRLQPFGPSKKDRKLIWVSDFEKTGYNRRAGKEIA